MSDFIDVVKYLDKLPVRVATLQEALDANIPFDKYYGKIPVRPIRKLFWYLSLEPNRVLGETKTARLVFQYNITAPAPFYILGVTLPYGSSSPNQMQCVGTIKWRNGSTVSRYCIFNSILKESKYVKSGHTFSLSFINTFPDYANQKVPANCVVELWSSFHDQLALPGTRNIGFDLPVVIQTSLMSNPLTASDTAIILDSGPALNYADMGVNLPETLPYNQPTIVWNDN